MLRLAADENFNQDIVRGVRRRNSRADIVCIQDVGLVGSADAEVLEWCAAAGRALLTHDVSTITRHAYDRVREGKSMPGVFEIGPAISLAQAIDDILLLIECSEDDEWQGQVRYLPL